jgi:glycosyltransferase involved in cell wall biosynthesis
MRIAQIAPIANPVRRDGGSAIETLVFLLTEELVRRGHDVTLFASGDSETSAKLRSVYPRSYGEDPKLWDAWEHHEAAHLGSAFERADDFDVIHSHVYFLNPAFARVSAAPTVHTSHLPIGGGVRADYARYPEVCTVAVSRHEAVKFEGMETPVVYNGIDTESFPFGEGGGDYLVFLGHLIERKGPVAAIRTAKEAGMPLVMAGRGSGEYFEREVAPLIDGEEIRHVGPVGAAERNELLSGAGALLFTSPFAEPFGLVMVEAMACGTPVVALERCAVPEIVDRKATGFYAKDVDSLAALVPEALALDRSHCREQARKRFDHRRMADEYEALYKRLTGRAAKGEGWWLA